MDIQSSNSSTVDMVCLLVIAIYDQMFSILLPSFQRSVVFLCSSRIVACCVFSYHSILDEVVFDGCSLVLYFHSTQAISQFLQFLFFSIQLSSVAKITVHNDNNALYPVNPATRQPKLFLNFFNLYFLYSPEFHS